MKKFSILILTIFFFLSGCNHTTQNVQVENTSNNYTISRTTTTNEKVSISPETDIATFSTKIYIKESGRQHNISLTISKLNGAIVKPGETFSFCNTVGKATAAEGYEKADIYDSEGNIIQGYGGGNCQVSSTLYNAVLNSPNLTIVERHEHSRKVNYVESGKDAAVAFGSIDFKFKNDNNYSIKIYASNTSDSVDIRIVKI